MRRRKKLTCMIDSRPQHALRLCAGHYRRYMRTGIVQAQIPLRPRHKTRADVIREGQQLATRNSYD